MAVIKVTTDNFEKEVLNSDVTVLADFNADWCGPCRMLKPIVEEIASENPNIKVVSINIDDEDELADEYNVAYIPCVVVFKNGVEVQRSIGFRPKNAIVDLLGE